MSQEESGFQAIFGSFSSSQWGLISQGWGAGEGGGS
jgi:hypothetical protein